MLVVAVVFALLASAFHVYVFVLESVRWMAPATRRTFGIRSHQEAEHTRPLALNQGFYNLFLAVGTVIGVVFLLRDATAPGAALVFAGCGSMALAGVVLVVSNPKMVRAALLQLVPPTVAAIALIICVTR